MEIKEYTADVLAKSASQVNVIQLPDWLFVVGVFGVALFIAYIPIFGRMVLRHGKSLFDYLKKAC